MTVHTVLLDFSLGPSAAQTDITSVVRHVEQVLGELLAGLEHLDSHQLRGGGSIRTYAAAEKDATVHLRVHHQGLVTVNIDYVLEEKEEPLLTYERCKELEKDVLDRVIGIKKAQSLPPLKRDERLLEYDTDEILFEEITPYQKVQIVHSKMLGNMLVLDDLQNIAESDLIYTETIMDRQKENYTDKEIVILGGGDGALLHELLKEKPKEVIMLEIDEVVMKACAKHMRMICGDVLDRYVGDNYKILVGDCMTALDQFTKEDRKFDYIFGDLTDVPISEKLSGQLWTFINKVLQNSFELLKPDGKFMTHLNGSACPESIEIYKSLLKKIQPEVKFTTSNAFIPSFMEEWVFCKVQFDSSKSRQT